MDLRLEYPSGPLPMTLLARRLYRSGDLDRFDALYVQSATATGHPDEVRVGTNFRRPVHVLPLDPPSALWPAASSDAILVLNDGRIPPSSGDGEAFVVSRVRQMTAWGICQRQGRPGHPSGVARRARSRIGSAGNARRRSTWSFETRARAFGRRMPAVLLLGFVGFVESSGASETRSGSPLAGPVEAGSTVTVAIPIVAPLYEGTYTVELDLLEHRSTVLGSRGGTRRLVILVTGA